MRRRFKHPMRMWGPKGVHWRREAIESFRRLSVEAQPGETWTVGYEGYADGRKFIYSEVGPVRILGDECPVPGYRGSKCVGEEDLDQEYRPLRWWTGLLPMRGIWSLVRGDDYEGSGISECQDDAGERLLSLKSGTPALVVWKSDHPVYAGTLFIVDGYAGRRRSSVDGRAGRVVSGTWVALDEATLVETVGDWSAVSS
jgi:hypothetical protein